MLQVVESACGYVYVESACGYVEVGIRGLGFPPGSTLAADLSKDVSVQNLGDDGDGKLDRVVHELLNELVDEEFEDWEDSPEDGDVYVRIPPREINREAAKIAQKIVGKEVEGGADETQNPDTESTREPTKGPAKRFAWSGTDQKFIAAHKCYATTATTALI